MILLIDVGNTRIKWAALHGRNLGEVHALSHASLAAADIRAQVLKLHATPERILIANVAGDDIAQRINTAVMSEWQLVPSYMAATASAAGLQNGYKIPAQLGVDRWVSIIAAHRLVQGAVCVVNIGTAMTIDAVDESGRHHGGVIVPGPNLMIDSLFARTSDIGPRAQAGTVTEEFFADNTLAAVHQGADHALAALIERAFTYLGARSNQPPNLLLSGGAGSRIAGLLQVPFRLVDHLVIRGLAELAGDSSS